MVYETLWTYTHFQNIIFTGISTYPSSRSLVCSYQKMYTLSRVYAFLVELLAAECKKKPNLLLIHKYVKASHKSQ